MDVGAGLYMYDVVVKKFTFAISSSDEFLSHRWPHSVPILCDGPPFSLKIVPSHGGSGRPI